MVVARDWGLAEMGSCWSKGAYKMSKVWGANVQHGDYG